MNTGITTVPVYVCPEYFQRIDRYQEIPESGHTPSHSQHDVALGVEHDPVESEAVNTISYYM